MNKDYLKRGISVLTSSLIVLSSMNGCTSGNIKMINESNKYYETEDGFLYKKGKFTSSGKDIPIAHINDNMDDSFSDDYTFSEVIGLINEITKVDDILKNNEFLRLENEYNIALNEGNIQKLNVLLSKISLLVLKAQIAEKLNVNIDNITVSSVGVDNQFIVNVKRTEEEINKGYETKYTVIGKHFNKVFKNILNLQQNKIEDISTIKSMYKELLSNTMYDLKIIPGETNLIDENLSPLKILEAKGHLNNSLGMNNKKEELLAVRKLIEDAILVKKNNECKIINIYYNTKPKKINLLRRS